MSQEGLTNITEKCLLAAIQNGLPLTSQPYQTLADQCNMTEQEVIETLQTWQQSGQIKRIGLVVHHHKLGLQANAMVVWNIPDSNVDEIGELLRVEPDITLCYKRKRQLPEWQYNLYCMIHGCNRKSVKNIIDTLIIKHNLQHFQNTILFSTHQFKQCGARYHQSKH